MAKYIRSLKFPTDPFITRSIAELVRSKPIAKPYDTGAVIGLTDDLSNKGPDAVRTKDSFLKIQSSFTNNTLQLRNDNGFYRGIIYSCTKFSNHVSEEDKMSHYYVAAVVRSDFFNDEILDYYLIDNPTIFTYLETSSKYSLYHSDTFLSSLNKSYILDKNLEWVLTSPLLTNINF